MKFERLTVPDWPLPDLVAFNGGCTSASTLVGAPVGALARPGALAALFALFAGDVDLFRERACRRRRSCSPTSRRCRPTSAAMTASRSRPSPASAGSNCPTTNIPPLVVHAFISAEDKNFFSHHGIDYPGADRRGVRLCDQERHGGGRARADRRSPSRSPNICSRIELQCRPQGARGDPRVPAGIDADQAADPRALPQLDLPRPQRLRRAGCGARLFRQGRQRADACRKRPISRCFPRRPANYDPVRATQKALDRRNYVLREMYRNGYITEDQCEAAAATPLGTIRYGSSEKFRQQGGYFMEEVRRELIKQFGENAEGRPEQPLRRRPVGAQLDEPGDAGCRRAGASRRPAALRRRPRLARPRT